MKNTSIVIDLYIMTGAIIDKKSLTPLQLHQLAEVSVKVGAYLGYPTCCTQWLLENRLFRTNELNVQQEAVHGSHGFIPCPACAEKVTAETIVDLIKNRQCPTPYPVWDPLDRIRFIKSLQKQPV